MSEEPSSSNPPPSKARTLVLTGVLGVLVLAFGLQFPAMQAWQKAQAAAESVSGTEQDHIPAEFMKAIGQTPMVKEDASGLTQIYFWKGGLMTFEIQIHFELPYPDKPGIYGSAESVEGGMKLRFAATDLSGFEVAQENTGTTFAIQPELEEPPSALTQSGGAPGPETGGGSNKGPGKGAGKGSGKGRLFNRLLAPPDELELTEEQVGKWEAAATTFRTNAGEVFTSGLPPAEIGTLLRELGDQFKKDLEAFLTEEQIEKLEEIRSRGRPGTGKGQEIGE